MRQQGNLVRTASTGRSLRHCGWTGALVASALLNASTDVSAQGTRNVQPLNLGPTQQQSGSKWYSKFNPWKESSGTPKTKMPSKRHATTVDEPSDEVKAEGQLSFARLAERRGQPEQAKTIYEAFVNLHSDNPLPFHRLGVMAAREGDYEKCDSYLSKAFHLDESNPDLLADIGYSMYLRGLTADAETFYRRALEFDRDHEAAANNLGMLLAESGRRTESLAMFKRVNDEAKAYANQGYILAQTGELEDAKNYFNHALTLDATLKPAAKGLMQVAEHQENLRSVPEFTHNRVPDQLAESIQPPSDGLPDSIAEPSKVTSEVASMVVIRDKDRALAPPKPLASSSSGDIAASSPPLATIADAKPTPLPQRSHTTLANRPAQDLSVRDANNTSQTKSSRRPQATRTTTENTSRPPAITQPTTQDPHMQLITTFSQLASGRAEPKATPISGVFTTRFSDTPEPTQAPSLQPVPEKATPTTPTSPGTRSGVNPVRPAAMSLESKQPVQPRATDMMNWVEHPHSNLALKNIRPVSQFQTQPTWGKFAEDQKPDGTASEDNK